MEGWGGKEKRGAKQTDEGRTNLLGYATNVFPLEDSGGESDGGKAYMFVTSDTFIVLECTRCC